MPGASSLQVAAGASNQAVAQTGLLTAPGVGLSAVASGIGGTALSDVTAGGDAAAGSAAAGDTAPAGAGGGAAGSGLSALGKAASERRLEAPHRRSARGDLD